MNKKFAFTLSEVLVTMSIIGVISALTVPTLVNNYQKKSQIIQLRKTANDIASAIDMLITEEGKSKFSATTEYNNLNTLVKNRLKTIKTCSKTEDKDDTGSCFANEKYYSVNGTGDGTTFSCDGNSYILASSAAICLTKTENNSVKINLDINGNQGPNIGGRDMFEFYIRPEGDISPCATGTCDPKEATCIASDIGKDCYGVITEANWQMNY